MKNIKICEGVSYIGVNDNVTKLFEGLWPLPNGVSYNSYVVKAEKTAIIDGGKDGFYEDYKRNLSEITPEIDYIVVNHVEPDHSGLLPQLLEDYPDSLIVTNKTAASMLQGFYGIPASRFKIVGNGDTLDLGGLTLIFMLTPMVHWPETMMTYLPEKKVLFSGDAFGCFGSLDGESVIDSEIGDVELYIDEMYRYYSNIVGKYGAYVTRALKALADTPIEYICSTHGPVWHRDIARVVDVYRRLAAYEGEDGVCIVFGSMYGNTRRLADEMASRLRAVGVKSVVVHEVTMENLSFVISDAFRMRGLIIGSPTYSMSLFPPIEAFIHAMKLREAKNKTLGLFGSYAWSPAALKCLESEAAEAGWFVSATLSMKLGYSDVVSASLDKFISDFASAYFK